MRRRCKERCRDNRVLGRGSECGPASGTGFKTGQCSRWMGWTTMSGWRQKKHLKS